MNCWPGRRVAGGSNRSLVCTHCRVFGAKGPLDVLDVFSGAGGE